MLVATTDTIAGQRITRTSGQVFGLAVRSRSLASNIMAGLAALDSDAMAEQTAALVGARNEAIARMTARAVELGANAVIQLRFDSAPVSHDMTEIIAYGTAVVIAPDE